MTELQPSEPSGHGVPQGEALMTWALWALVLAALAVTYTRTGHSDLYHVSRDGISGGLSRVLVEVNFPLALIAIALILIALDVLPSGWWWVGVPAIVSCAVTAWPGVVDEGDLDARLINVIPALGAAMALVMTVAAATRTGTTIARRQRFDTARIAMAAAILVLSLPWLAADLGFFLPDVVFITERPITGSDGRTFAAVHLGHHHGFDGALIVISALLLSRPRLRSQPLATATRLYVSLMFAYGAVNFAQDLWHEQIQKRGWTDWLIPDAIKPTFTVIWLVILAIAVVSGLVMRHEANRHTQPPA